LSHPLWYVLLPAGTTILGGFLASLWTPGESVRATFQHLAAGIVLAVTTIEVIPELELSQAPPAWILAVFASGCLAMFALSWWTKSRRKRGGAALGLIIASGIDMFIDGLTIGAGLRVGAGTGLLLALGIAVELSLLGLTAATESTSARSRWQPLGLTAIYALGLVGGALLGWAVLGKLPHTATNLVLAFGAAALLYLVAEELLVEAHEEEDPARNTIVLFAGFIGFWGLRLALPA
jgi:ZIP family zinc transporter